jgi:hypothetical protein
MWDLGRLLEGRQDTLRLGSSRSPRLELMLGLLNLAAYSSAVLALFHGI